MRGVERGQNAVGYFGRRLNKKKIWKKRIKEIAWSWLIE